MLIPSIDLQGGRIVQLVQGESLALESHDIDGWIARFARYPKVQLIDLDAAKGQGNNDTLIRYICPRLPCRVGGGVRSIERAGDLLALGASKVILGSALFRGDAVHVDFAADVCSAFGAERLIAAVDSRQGRVVVHGWRTQLSLTTVDAIRALDPYVGEFLYTHVDSEGLMRGTDLAAIKEFRAATTRALTAAGGIASTEEIDLLNSLGVDAVVGMALYTGRLH